MCTRTKIQRGSIRGMERPIRIKRKRGEASGFDLLQDIFPHLWHGEAPVVPFAGEDVEALAVDFDAVVVPLDDFVEAVVVEGPLFDVCGGSGGGDGEGGKEKCGEEEGEETSQCS